MDQLRDLPLNEIAALPADQLVLLQDEADEALRTTRINRARIDDALVTKYAAAAAALRRAAGKDTGTVRLQDGPVTVVADLSKRVDWDQTTLASLVERITSDGDDPTEYVDIAFKVSERKYNSWPNHIKTAFQDARTVRTGKESFKLILGEDSQ
ncbi:MAG: hypothetical protein O3A51_14060 [Verrucomicrobia bacterium]|nr:hypothetical protein [Verrucomicrobiota bacterium]